MPDISDKGSEESHAARIRNLLRSAILQSTPRSLWSDLGTKGRHAYQDSYDSNNNDPRLVQNGIQYKTTWDRHFFMDRVLYDAGLGNKCPPFPSMVQINKWHYTQIDCGPFHALQKFVRSMDDMPLPAKFRKALAAAGQLRRQGDFWRPTLVDSENRRLYHAVVIHSPASRHPSREEFRDLGYIGLAFPYDDYLSWAAKFSLDEIMSWYENLERENDQPRSPMLPGSEDGADLEIGPTPEWKINPIKKE